MRRPLRLPNQWRPRLVAALSTLDVDLARQTLQPLGAGLDFWAFALGDDIVVRCPQHDEGARNLATEQRVLPLVARYVPAGLVIPEPLAQLPNPLGPGDLGVSRRVPGQILSTDEWAHQGLLEHGGIVDSIAVLIDSIAAVDTTAAAVVGVRSVTRRRLYEGQQSRIAGEVSAVLGDVAVAKRLERVWSSFLADDGNFTNDTVLIHADISLDHLLVDISGDGPRITGLIDFGDVAIDDPDYELSYLFAEGGIEFVRRIQTKRGRQLDHRLVAKLRFYELADAVTDVLWGLDYNDAELVEESVTLVRQHLQDFR